MTTPPNFGTCEVCREQRNEQNLGMYDLDDSRVRMCNQCYGKLAAAE